MDPAPDNLTDGLKALAAGDLDALTPEQVERLEALLNDDARLAAAIRNQRPGADPQVAGALSKLDRVDLPTAEGWERVWQRIDSAAVMRRRGDVGIARRVVRWWRPLMAAAACLLLVLGWRVTRSPVAKPWPLQLATDVEIDNLEVFQGATSFVVAVGGDNGGEIIWVLPAGSGL